MFENALYETPYVEQIYTEYLSFINRYNNLQRKSIFCRYYNINKNASSFNKETGVVFDRYNSGVLYDLYDYTPLHAMTNIVNESANEEDMAGQKFIANADITTYTIKEPRIEDLVVFNNKPLDGSEIFRVSNIRASINSMNSSPNINWFQCSIEYAPIIDVSKINILNHYVYCLPMQKYLFHDDFTRFVKNVQTFNKILTNFEKSWFDNYQELYFININGERFFPKYENKILYEFLAKKNFLSDQFANIKRPYSVSHISDMELKCDCLQEDYCSYYNLKPHNINISCLDENYQYDIFDICEIIHQWQWYLNYEKYPAENSDIDIPDYTTDDITNVFLKNGILYKTGPKTDYIINVRNIPTSSVEELYGCI